MKRKVSIINLAPTPEGYAYALLAIIDNHIKPTDIAWAKSEIVNAFKVAATVNPEKWGRKERIND